MTKKMLPLRKQGSNKVLDFYINKIPVFAGMTVENIKDFLQK